MNGSGSTGGRGGGGHRHRSGSKKGGLRHWSGHKMGVFTAHIPVLDIYVPPPPPEPLHGSHLTEI